MCNTMSFMLYLKKKKEEQRFHFKGTMLSEQKQSQRVKYCMIAFNIIYNSICIILSPNDRIIDIEKRLVVGRSLGTVEGEVEVGPYKRVTDGIIRIIY